MPNDSTPSRLSVFSRYFWGLFLFLLTAPVIFQVPAIAEENVIAIVNAVIIDGNGEAPLEGGTLIIRGESIAAVGKDLEIPSEADLIDADGMVLMPGLADMHVHLTWAGEGHDLLGYQRRLNGFLVSGVTTVFDMGGVLPYVQQIHQAIEAGKIPGPSLYYVGPLIDSVDPNWPSVSLSMASKAQAAGIAKFLKDNGARGIKAYGNLSGPQIRALIHRGREQGLPVYVDAWVRNGAEHLVNSGLHAFAHTPFRVTEQTLQTMKEKEVAIISTRAVGGIEKRARVQGLSFLNHELVKNITPPWLLARAREKAAEAVSRSDPENERWHKQLQTNVKKVFDAGILLVAGTDSDGLITGEVLHFELELLVDAGLTPLETITVATRNAARLVGEEDQWGTLEPGKRADLLLVDGRPDKNISDTRNLRLVMKKGRVIDRRKLVFNQATDAGIRDTKFGY